MPSHTHQDETVAQPELPSPVNVPHVTQREGATDATPIKRKYKPDLTFTSAAKNFEKVRSCFGKEMDGRWLGAMPVNEFLNEFLRPADAPLPDLAENPFEDVPREVAESARYGPFITAIQGWMPHLLAVNTSNRKDTANQMKLKTDISIYNRVEGVTLPSRPDFSQMELWIEFKTKTDDAAFEDPPDATEESRLLAIKNGSFTPDTVEGNKARGQLAQYASAQHSLQFRHFSFSVFVEGDNARLLRWDSAGTVVTAAFNYRTEARFMAEFLWRFDHLSARDRGHDESIRPANLAPEVDARVREKLQMKNNKATLYKYELPGLIGMGHAYGPRPPSRNRSLASRCTRNLPVVWIPAEDVPGDTRTCGELDSPSEGDAGTQTGQGKGFKKGPWSEERIVYMKDTWRFVSYSPNVEVMAEHDIYEILHQHEIPNIPEHVVGGDIGGGRTKTQEFKDAPWLCVWHRISPLQHYRLIHGIVGRALSKFECTKQLVTAVFDALRAHSRAFEVANVLHRDISAGNIILTDEGRGLLIDWELAVSMDEHGSRVPGRTGTWQFMSGNMLRHEGKVHTYTDDLESFLHVLGWMTLCYVPADDTYLAFHRDRDTFMFDEYFQLEEEGEQYGGDAKSRILGVGMYPSQDFQPRKSTPLLELIQELSKPFRSLYRDAPTDKDRLKTNVPTSEYDDILTELWVDIRRHDREMQQLQSSSYFINVIEKALDRSDWPTDDKAYECLPFGFSSSDARKQFLINASQIQTTPNLWGNSKGLPRNLKRVAVSLITEPRAKRLCGVQSQC